MASQSPLISIPRKGTDDVDWTSPIRSTISQSYGEDPDNYATECASLQRCRQDAVKGAGSDITGAYPSFLKDKRPRHKSRPRLTLQVLRTTRTSRTTLPGNSRQFPMARCIHQQADRPDITGVREGVHYIPDCRDPFCNSLFPEPLRPGGPEARVLLPALLRWDAHIHQ